MRMRKVGDKFFHDRMSLFNKAKDQLENFDYSVVKDRGCDVDARTKKENEKVTRTVLNRVITNITEYLIRIYGVDPNEVQDDN